MPGLPPFLEGYESARQGNQQATQSQLGILSQLSQLEQIARKNKLQEEAAASLKNLGPDFMKNPDALYNLGLTQSAAGNHDLGSAALNVANHLSQQQQRRDPSQMERGLDTIKKAYGKFQMNQELKPDEVTDLHNAVAVVGQVRTALDPVTQRMETMQPLTMPGIYSPMFEKYGVVNGKPAEVFKDPAGNGRKAIDQASEKELQGFNDASTQLFDLAKGFKPNYGGWMLDPVGQGAIMAGRRLPDSVLKAVGQPDLSKQAEWWQNYYNWSNDVRAAKFGLTLTGNELTAFERATPKPSDKPEVIANGLKQQLDILRNKQENRTSGLVAGGYNPEQVRQTAGHERSIVPNDEAAIRMVEDAGRRGQLATSMPMTQDAPKSWPKPNAKAIDRLTMNPTPAEKALFEEVFGPGSAAKYGR